MPTTMWPDAGPGVELGSQGVKGAVVRGEGGQRIRVLPQELAALVEHALFDQPNDLALSGRRIYAVGISTAG
jgi:hypothetical protein